MYKQTDPLVVNQPVVATTVILRRTGEVTVTVLDEANQPVQGAAVDIAGIKGTTDATGKVVLATVPYGNDTITTEIA
jgi:hypothetical protein